MHIETLGQYQLVLSAMQSIQNGGWTAYASVRSLAAAAGDDADILPYQRIGNDTLFASEAAAIAGARSVALEVIAPGMRTQ
ncbi:hypothetical protein [Paraburkholderia phosphatilytica]|uniref:hypothetical protein n=1 Tax=Paraburkholderia phosphatilytica TaxID=2282883 RepID=UPI000E530587|nr:hypothetical protein [Paraburkholderia phosphatilytica]